MYAGLSKNTVYTSAGNALGKMPKALVLRNSGEMMTDTLANMLNMMNVAETKGKPSALLNRPSKLLTKILEIFKEEGFIEDFAKQDEGVAGLVDVKLIGKINKCKVIKPRFSVKAEEWEKWESRYLPAREMGIIIVSTSKGLMTHKKAKDLKIGGRLIAFAY